MQKLMILVMLLIFALLAGCAEKEQIALPNVPPETYVALADSVRNPTVYIQVLHWWGDDRDGEVIGYEYKWVLAPSQSSCNMDTAWTFTEATHDTFYLPVSSDSTTHRFYVRSIDDDGAYDPTPASVALPLVNSPPKVWLWDIGSLPDTTYPAITLKWHAEDPEGQETIAEYLLWLDGDAVPRSFGPTDTIATLTPEDFKGTYGVRSLYLVAVDTGCDTSNVVTYTWYVREPEGNVLLIDNLPRSYAGYRIGDRFYRGSLDSCIGEYSILDIEHFGGNRYTHAFEALFDLFDMVIWYNEPWHDPGQGRDTLLLSTISSIVPAYVEKGGRFILASHAAVGTRGVFNDSIGFAVFGIDTVYLRDASTDFDCKRWVVFGNAGIGLENVKVNGLFMGAECMKPASQATPLFYIPPGTAIPEQDVNYYVGIMNSYGAGKAALITFPLSRSNSYHNNQYVFCKLLELMLN